MHRSCSLHNLIVIKCWRCPQLIWPNKVISCYSLYNSFMLSKYRMIVSDPLRTGINIFYYNMYTVFLNKQEQMKFLPCMKVMAIVMLCYFICSDNLWQPLLCNTICFSENRQFSIYTEIDWWEGQLYLEIDYWKKQLCRN